MPEHKSFINLILCGSALLFITACSSVIFQPSNKLYYTPDQYDLEYEQSFIPVAKGIKLHAWYLPARAEPMSTIIYLHGNAQNMSAHLNSVSWLPQRGFNVLLYDYRGYGQSQGEPSVDNSIADLDQVLQWIINKKGLATSRLIVFGQSLGGALAIKAMAKSSLQNCVAGLVIDSSFSDLRLVARDHLAGFWPTWPLQHPLSLAFSGDFKPEESISQLQNKAVLIIHGTDDRVVPYYHGQALYQNANNPKTFWRIDKGRHIDFSQRKEYRDRLEQYLKKLVVGKTQTTCRSIQTG